MAVYPMTIETAEMCGARRVHQEFPMTRFAKPLLLEAPCCQEKVLQQRFASLNSFGLTTVWSDGYTDMPFVSETSRLAYCSGCNKVYWLEDAKELGVVSSFDEAPARRQRWLPKFLRRSSDDASSELEAQVELRDLDYANFHEQPRPADLLLAVLREEWTTLERELYLRTRLWWISNHGQRGRRISSPMNDEQARDNMLRLLAIHRAVPVSERGHEAIAELLRQLGSFDEAIAELSGGGSSGARAAVILAAAERGKTPVQEVETY